MQPRVKLFVTLWVCMWVAISDIRAAEPVPQTVPLTVTGRATDARGEPVPRAAVFLASVPESGRGQVVARTVADEDGNYVFRDVALPVPVPRSPAYFRSASFQILGEARGLAFAWHPVRHVLLDERFQFDPAAAEVGQIAGRDFEINLTFTEPYPVAGQVVTEDGEPLVGARVTLIESLPITRPGRRDPPPPPGAIDVGPLGDLDSLRGQTDALGRFEFSGVPAARICRVTIEHPDYLTLQAKFMTADELADQKLFSDLRALPLVMTLPRLHNLAVKVVATGSRQPVAGVRLLAHTPPQGIHAQAQGVSDDQGLVTWRLPAGEFVVRAVPPTDSDCLAVIQNLVWQAGQERPVELALERGAHLKLRVVDRATQQGVSEVAAWFRPRPEGERRDLQDLLPVPDFRLTNAAGVIELKVPPGTRRYGISILPQSDYELIDPADGKTGRELSLTAGGTATLEFQVTVKPAIAAAEAAAVAEPADEKVVITGQVVYEGEPPPKTIIQGMLGDTRYRRSPPVFDESLLVDAETRGVAHVIVFLALPPEGVPVPPMSRQPVDIEIRDGQFSPRVVLVRTLQRLRVSNHDAESGDFHIEPLRNSPLNRLVRPGETITWRFDKPEALPFIARSNLLPGSRSVVFVTGHPWVAVSDQQGRFAIRGLPPGKYQFKVWHERIGYLHKSLEVEVRADQPTDVPLVYPVLKL
ncbi:MAG: hypothetical protein JSS02_09140 [Planctomycetes bacterium]|nr:hypothetical protein [Planctomycetota bacterium]